MGQLLDNGTLRPPRKPGLLAQLGQYDLLRLIGEGGMGIVFEAVNGKGEAVAIKFLRPILRGEAQSRQRFLHEVRLMRELNTAAGSANTWFLPILDSDEAAPCPWFAMPMMRQGNLADKIHRERGLNAEEVLRITEQVAEALRFAHHKATLHCDLKPENILFDDAGRIRLADLGLSRNFSGDSVYGVQQSHQVGTPAYMSPAVAQGRAEDTRGDIYSLGAVMYEMLTGHPPYTGGTAEEVLQQISRGPPPPILKLNPKASPGLAGIAEKAMARDLAARYASLDHLLGDLEREKLRAAGGGWRVDAVLAWLRWRLRARTAWIVAGFALVIGAWALWYWLTPSLRVIDQFTLEAASDSDIYLREIRGRPTLIYLNGQDLYLRAAAAKEERRIPLRHFPQDAVGRPGLAMVEDSNGDGSPDCWVQWSEEGEILRWFKDGESLRTNFWRCTAKAMAYTLDNVTLSPIISVPGLIAANRVDRKDCTHLAPVMYLTNGWSGRPEVLARTFTSWGPDFSLDWNVLPRGLISFDAKTGATLWQIPLPTTSGDLRREDLDGDGQAEIVLGTSSSDNYFKLYDGTDDSHTYLYVFTNGPALAWRRELSDAHNRVELAFSRRTGPGDPRIYAWVSGAHSTRWNYLQQPEIGRIAAFDERGRTVLEKDFGTSQLSFLPVDFDDDGELEFLSSDRFGRLHLLDSKLEVLATRQVVNTNGARLVRSVNLEEVRACTNLAAHWDRNRTGYENGPPPGQTGNCENLFAHGITNFADFAYLKLVGLGKLLRSGRPLVAAIALLEEYPPDQPLRTMGNELSKTTESLRRNLTLLLLDDRLRTVAEYSLAAWKSDSAWTARLVDWDGDGLQEVLVTREREVRVLKLH